MVLSSVRLGYTQSAIERERERERERVSSTIAVLCIKRAELCTNCTMYLVQNSTMC